MKYLIGIDGGGSQTRAVAVDYAGHVAASSITGPTQLQFLDTIQSHSVLNSLLSELIKQAGTNLDAVAYLVAGFAGAGRQPVIDNAVSILEDIGFRGNCSVVTDLDIALHGAFAGEPGIVVNAGTGSGAICRDNSGTVSRCGGWGYLIGDEGSAYHMARLAIQAVFKSCDGIIQSTLLTEQVCSEFYLNSPDDLITVLYSGKLTRVGIAAFAPRVFDAAKNGDYVAQNIVKECGSTLSLLIKTLLKSADFSGSPVPVCCTGGMFENSDILLSHILNEDIDNIAIVKPRFSSIAGAVLLAFEHIAVKVDASIAENVQNIPIL